MKVSVRSRRFGHYRGECADAPGWYPTSTLAASASHAPAARLGNPPPQAGSKPPGGQDNDGVLSAGCQTRRARLREMWRPMDVLVFRLYGGEEREREGKKSGGNITLASPPSRRFLTRPHCVLLPHKLSLSGPHQLCTRLLLLLFFFSFLLIHLFYCTLRMTQASAHQFISTHLHLRACMMSGTPDNCYF